MSGGAAGSGKAAGARTPRALVTGLAGQDGSFLAELLLGKGYDVFGTVRAGDSPSLGASEHLREQVGVVPVELLDPSTLATAVSDLRPDELYHLAAPSFVPESWERPSETMVAIGCATAALLEAVRDSGRDTKVFVAASGAIFGGAVESPQREDTPPRPCNPYATAKLAAHQLVGQLRAHDGLFACSGVLYNHESERRPESFVPRKIARTAATIKLGLADHVSLGDLEAVRDWSFAGDVMRGAWLMLQHERPGDYILASGVPHTVADLARVAFEHVGLDPTEYIRVDPRLVRPPDETPLVGDPTRARERLGWHPTLSFEQLIQRMVDADLRALEGA